MSKIAIIGGGAAGMTCAVFLARKGFGVTVYERGERLGRKLSVTGNGQGNVTNTDMGASRYFSDLPDRVERTLARFGAKDTVAFFEGLGGLFLPDARGRVYPAGRQASAVTDLLRGELMRLGAEIRTGAYVRAISERNGKFTVLSDGVDRADAAVLCAGGMAAPNFGTDGNAYALAQAFGHTVTALAPVLVQLRCDPASVRGLKGIRADSRLFVVRGGETVFSARGDVLFTESGVSGDAVFRASSYARTGDRLFVDLLPDVSREKLSSVLAGREGEACLLCVVNNGLGRALYKRAGGDKDKLPDLIKRFPLTVTGTLGFAYAQATRGGIPLAETDEDFQSLKQKGLYFAGEILNADGECGGYNLQWAFSTAYCVSEGIGRCFSR